MLFLGRAGLVTAAALALSAGAAAQCSFWISDVPDLDQKRLGDLPGDGKNHCVPTSVTNWMAYFANRGASQPSTLDGPRNWQSQTSYGRVTTTINTMGVLMNTSASSGTKGNDGLNGARTYVNLFAPGKFSISHFWCGGGDCPTPYSMWFTNMLGGRVAASYGRYNESPASSFTRDGGHCITVKAIKDDNCADNATFRFMDPASSDGYNSTQDVFKMATASIVPVTALFRGKSNQSFYVSTRYRVFYGDGFKFLDGWYAIYPTFAVTSGGGASDGATTIQIVRPWRPTGSGLPAVDELPKPLLTGQVLDMAQHPYLPEIYYITDGVGGTVPQPARLWKLDPVTGASTSVLSAVGLKRLTFNRFGDLYVVDDETIRYYTMDTSPPTLVRSITPTDGVDAIAMDDKNDQLAVLSDPLASAPGQRRLRRFTRTLFLQSANDVLPNTTLNGDGSVFADPETPTAYWVTSSQSRNISKFEQTAAGITTLENILVPAGLDPLGLQVGEDGHVLFSSGGFMREMEKTAAGGWVLTTGSPWANMPGGARVALSRSRTNHDPALHEGPEWANIVDPDLPPEGPDCYANCDASTVAPVLNALDFSCFLAQFRVDASMPARAQTHSYANCDGSTVAPVLNALDFACFLTAYRAGCP